MIYEKVNLEINWNRREDIYKIMNNVQPSFRSMWYKPREVVRYLHQSQSSHFRIIGALAFIYFIQLSTYVLFLEKLTFAPLLSLKGLQLILYVLLFLGIGSFVAINVVTLMIWLGAKCMNGQGTLLDTRAAVIWTFVGLIPIGFFLLLLYFVFRHQNLEQVGLVIEIASYLGLLITLVCGFIILLTTISETHRFGLWRSFLVVVLGVVMISTIVYSALTFFY